MASNLHHQTIGVLFGGVFVFTGNQAMLLNIKLKEVTYMEVTLAKRMDTEQVYELVQETIRTVYPKQWNCIEMEVNKR